MKQSQKAIILCGIAVLSWSTVATAFKVALSVMPVYSMVLTASLTATLIFVAALTITGKWSKMRQIDRSTASVLVAMGLINPVVYYLVLFTAYDFLPAQVAQPINYVWPIAVLVLLAVFNHEPIPPRKYIGMAMSLAGVAAISFGGKGITGQISATGIALGATSAIFWAAYWMLSNRTKGRIDPLVTYFSTFAIGSVVLIAGTPVAGFELPSAQALCAGAYIGAFEMAIPFICFGIALNLTDNPALINQMCYLSPFLSLFFISAILGEPIMPTTYIGLAIIVAGLFYNQYVAVPKASVKARQ